MELRHLRYFVAVAHTLNMRKAAEILHTAQPSLSVQIRDLERQVGVALFRRHNNRLSLTDAGAQFLRHAETLLDDAQRAIEKTRLADRGQVGELRVHFIGSAVSGLLQKTILRYRRHFPDVRLLLRQSTSEEILAALRADEIDIGFIRTRFRGDGELVRAADYHDSYVVALPAGHPLSKRKKLAARDLADEPLIQYPRHTAHSAFDHIMSLLVVDGVTPPIAIEAEEQTTIASLVAAGLGYSVVPACMMQIKIPGIVHVPLAGGEKATGIAIVHRRETDSIVNGFLSTL